MMIFENKNLFFISRLNRFLFIGGINDKFKANSFFIFRFLLVGFYCIMSLIYTGSISLNVEGRGRGVDGCICTPLACHKGPINLRGRVKMTLRMQEKWTSTT